MWDGLWKRDKESMLTQLKKECKMMTKNKELAKSYPGTLKTLGWVWLESPHSESLTLSRKVFIAV